jgi:lycopene beta-cyclase
VRALPADTSSVYAEQAVMMRSRRMWQSIWPASRLQQRALFTFGMEVIVQLDLTQMRQFLSAFFALSDFHLRGFLSSRLSVGELILFALTMFANSCNQVRLNLVSAGIPLFPGMILEIIKSQTALPPATVRETEK